MAAGHQATFDEITTLIAGTSSLVDDSSGVTAFERASSRLDMLDMPDTSVHRKFHVIFDGAEPFSGSQGSFSGNILDDYLLATVQVGYFEGGGDAYTYYGERHSVDRVAMDDLNRMRQRLCNPANYNGATSGIQIVHWLGVSRLSAAPDSQVRVYEAKFKVWVRHATLS